MGLLKKFLQLNFKISMKFDALILPASMRVYGTSDIHKTMIPEYVDNNSLVYDIGGGKNPHIFPQMKQERNITTIGLDIDEEELARAPEGGYDQTICADITKTTGEQNGDFVISRATLEHVKDGKAAVENMVTFVKPGGRLILFAPCRHAFFAKLNYYLPEKFKRKLIDFLFTDMGEAHKMGFKAYYSYCTPSEMEKIFADNDLDIIERRIYWMSNYFAFFAPIHIIWRLYQLIVRALGFDDLSEGFGYVLELKNYQDHSVAA